MCVASPYLKKNGFELLSQPEDVIVRGIRDVCII